MHQWFHLLAQVSKPILSTLVYAGTSSFLNSIQSELKNQQKQHTKRMLNSVGIKEQQLGEIQDSLQNVISAIGLDDFDEFKGSLPQQQLIAQQQDLWQMVATAQQTTLRQLPETHKNLEHWPLRLSPAQLQTASTADVPLPLRIFLLPPKVPFQGFERIGLETQEIEQKLAQGLREFLSQNYSSHCQVRPTEFLGGAWQSHNFHGEASIKMLFEKLREQPTLILESEIEGDYLNLRIAYWDFGQDKYCYETILRLSYRELLEESVIARALKWKDTRERLLALGKNPKDIERLGGKNALNLAIWLEAEQLQTAGIDIKELTFDYQIDRKDWETLCQFVTICQCLVTGWVADFYYLVNYDLPPHLPQIIPQLTKQELSEPKSRQAALRVTGAIYQSVFSTLANQRADGLHLLGLKLAQSLAHLPDKLLAREQLSNSFQIWLKQRQLFSIEGREDLAKIELTLTPKDREYLETLKTCLSELEDESGLKQVQELLRKLNNCKTPTPHTQLTNCSLLHTFTLGAGKATPLAISPDGGILISISDRRTIELRSFQRGGGRPTNSSLKLSAHQGEILTFTLSRDSKTLASSDRTVNRSYIKIWNLQTGNLQRTLFGHKQPIRSLAIGTYHSHSPRQFLASGSHKIKLWDLATGESFQTLFGHKQWVSCLAISPDARILISGSEDTTIRIWDLTTGDLICTLKGHQGCVRSLTISPDGRTLISGSDDQTIKLWDLKTGQLLYTFIGHSGAVRALTICTKSQHLISGSEDKTIKMWHLQTKNLLRTLTGHAAPVKAIAISPDGQTLASGSSDRTIKIWQARQELLPS
ncbi:MAG: WD40 repeat domain-containing protein [Pleurocapsa sp. MO_226.B13]|nr:WD40 repeat domain-containing protein [Pleurocapsa sp. MO_226.B13]